jgi:hypothetical protein
MDSNRKYHENQEASTELASAVNREIYRYKLRKLLAQDEYADVVRYRDKLELYSDLRLASNIKLKEIQAEIDLCNEQIRAYQENNNKAKLIPDRLL